MPRPGDILKVPASLLDEHTCFTIVMPGRLDWDVGVSLKRNFPLWPVLETLNSENLLTVAEIAAAPLGKVAFLSRNPSILVRFSVCIGCRILRLTLHLLSGPFSHVLRGCT